MVCLHAINIGVHYPIYSNINQGLFQDFASEGANAKFQNSRGGGKYKAKEGQPHIKRTEKPIPRGGGANGSQGGGAKVPPGPPLK